MTKQLNLISLALITILVMIDMGCATRKALSDNYLGRWKYIVPDLTDNNTGVLIINREGSGYTCLAITDGGYEQPFETCTIEEDQFMGSYNTQGMKVTVEGIIDNNMINGKAHLQGMEFTWSAVKEE